MSATAHHVPTTAPHFHAVVWLDHQGAHVLQFDRDSVDAQRVRARSHHPRHAGVDAAARARYFGEIAAALAGVQALVITGPGQAPGEFATWLDSHQPALAQAVRANEVSDHPSDAQLVALARRHFVGLDRMAGVPTPTL